jgi:probable HAF family extracellular repeat protein
MRPERGGHPRAITESGIVVGIASNRDRSSHPFLWADGVMTDLGVPAGTTAAGAVDVNERLQVSRTVALSVRLFGNRLRASSSSPSEARNSS